MDKLTLAQAKEFFLYDEETGKLLWRASKGKTRSGEEVGAWHHSGYRRILIKGKTYWTHRVIWLMAFGVWPSDQIDHIDGNRGNNLLSNLRDVVSRENSKNQKLRKTNSSGVPGVSWNSRDHRWQAHISGNGKRIHLGYFTDLDSAVAARKAAELTHGYHQNHGRQSCA